MTSVLGRCSSLGAYPTYYFGHSHPAYRCDYLLAQLRLDTSHWMWFESVRHREQLSILHIQRIDTVRPFTSYRLVLTHGLLSFLIEPSYFLVCVDLVELETWEVGNNGLRQSVRKEGEKRRSLGGVQQFHTDRAWLDSSHSLNWFQFQFWHCFLFAVELLFWRPVGAKFVRSFQTHQQININH